jgi:Na+/melibiose symporter-like transporter
VARIGFELILGVGIVAALLVYLANMFDPKDHFFLRLLFIAFAIIALIPLSKGVIDSTTTCESVINTTTLDSLTNTTTYTYTSFCFDNTSSTTSLTLYKLSLWVSQLFAAYVVFYFVYWLFQDRVRDLVRKCQAYFRRKK